MSRRRRDERREHDR